MDSLIVSIIIATVSILLIPVCVIGCKRCAMYLIRNVGETDNDYDNGYGNSHGNSNGGDGDDTRNDTTNEGNNTPCTSARDERDRRRREQNILKRVIVKVRENIIFIGYDRIKYDRI
jgi:hypothetical protein